MNIPGQTAITKDNVTISIDGVLYIQITDPMAASYGVEDPVDAITQLAQTTMRSELGKITLDKTFEERESLNRNIIAILNEAGVAWGVSCLRYEIRDILPPPSIRDAMDLQAEAERRKRATVTLSEGDMDAAVNKANGLKKAQILEAEGSAVSIKMKAEASAEAIKMQGEAILREGGQEAVTLRVAEQYVAAFHAMAKESNTLILPANTNDAAGMVAQAMAVFKSSNVSAKGSGAQRTDVEGDFKPSQAEIAAYFAEQDKIANGPSI